MKKITLLLTAAIVCAGEFAFAQSGNAPVQKEFHGSEAAAICPGSKTVIVNKQSRVPSFIVFRPDANVPVDGIFEKLRGPLQMMIADGWKLKRTDKDQLGFTHYRYDQTYNNVRVENGEYLVHARNGKVESVNGMWMDGITVNTTPALTEATALQDAMNFTGAQIYKWQIAAAESELKETYNDPKATYFPKGELVIMCSNNDIFKKDYHLAWKFDIFAAVPFSRKFVYVDAQTGAVIATKDRIHEADVPGTGATRYSGTQNFTCDNYASGQYRLRESGRGQGIRTLNAQNSTNTTGAPDFNNTSATWTSNANGDNVAYDAHWGAEKTYDYYQLQHNRNGLDGNGLLMVSYVHYDSGLDNAYWDGQAMNYGDGTQQPGGFNPLVAIDVCGHEFSHGVTQYTCNLDYQNESGAMNEAFSDIMGTCIEFYAKPATADFLIGEEITVDAGTALRDMSNPGVYGQPDTYLGNNWYSGFADNGGVHTNSGVENFWFYLLCQGGTGTNDNSNNYNVSGIGMTSAADIAFRMETVYLVNTSQYADARTYSTQAAIDLFGACSPEQTANENAWYAVGVGGPYSAVVTASFSADITTSCSLPLTVNFTNNSTNAANATWNFGDNTTSTVFSPSHTYTQAGTYSVALSVNSACGADSTLQTSYIDINPPAMPTAANVSNCSATSFTLNANGSGTLNWYTTPTGGTAVGSGGSYVTPVLSSTTTYYVENAVPQPPGFVGPTSYNFGTGGQHNNTSTQYLEFTVYQPCTLATADVNAGGAGNRTFTLWDNAGNQLNQYTVNIPSAGVQTVTLNIPLSPGSYRIGGTQMNLYRNNSGASYPYTLNNVVSITGSSAGSAYYYYLYNWQLTLPACTSGRTPVVATVGGLNVTYSTAGYDTVCTQDAAFALTGGTPAGGTYSGPGVTAGMFDPVTAGAGAQTITYTYTDSTSCTGTSNATIYVDDCLGIHSHDALSGISVYPNPASNFVTVELQMAASQEMEVSLLNMLGQTVYASNVSASSGTTKMNISTSTLPRGIYLLRVKTSSGIQTRKVELQ